MRVLSRKLRRTQLGAPPEGERGLRSEIRPHCARGHQTTGKQIGLAGAKEPGLFWAVDYRPCHWLLRLRPRHGGDLAYECAGRFAVAFIPDGDKCFFAVLSFRLAGWSNR